jgi:hypothetical protein
MAIDLSTTMCYNIDERCDSCAKTIMSKLELCAEGIRRIPQ